jgi:hypothetical protein
VVLKCRSPGGFEVLNDTMLMLPPAVRIFIIYAVSHWEISCVFFPTIPTRRLYNRIR